MQKVIQAHGVPWIGEALPLSDEGVAVAADALEVPLSHLVAVLRVEAAGDWFEPNKAVIRRFEPHKFNRRGESWRKYLKLSKSKRAKLFREAYAKEPARALESASWGGPQILGSNYEMVGYSSALDMVRAFAKGADYQLEALCRYILETGLRKPLAAGDFVAFARGYNGSGQALAYGKRLAREVERLEGEPVKEVVSLGDVGSSVVKVREALGLGKSRVFDAETEAAVRKFQREQGLVVDGIVGAQTWREFERVGLVKGDERSTEASFQNVEVGPVIANLSAGGTAMAAVERAAPVWAYQAIWGLVIALLIGVAVFQLFRRFKP